MLEVIPVAGAIGAELRGVKLSGGLAADTVAQIRTELLKHKVIFFRDQHDLDDAGHEAFALQFGELLRHPLIDAAGKSDALMELTEGFSASNWHTDITFMLDPPAFSIMRPVALPPFGGDTLWANTVNAYEKLPNPLKILADNLWALHTSAVDFGGRYRDEYKKYLKEYRANSQVEVVDTEHPVVRIHPETGERSLVLGSWLKRFVGLTDGDSAKIFDVLQGQVELPENSVRWSWRLGDVAMWDNRATQHRSVPDYGDAQRIIRRATIAGSVPTAIDGRQSFRHNVEAVPQEGLLSSSR